ncbi:hypothetical protein GCM10027415_21600 [Humibacter ginsengisoli]
MRLPVRTGSRGSIPDLEGGAEMIWAWVTVGFVVAAMGLGALFLAAAVVSAREQRARSETSAATTAAKADTSRSHATLSER